MHSTIVTISTILAFASAFPLVKRDFVSPKYPDLLPGAAVSYRCTEANPCGVTNDPIAGATIYTANNALTACGMNDPNHQYSDIMLNDQVDDYIALSAAVMGSLSSGLEMNPTCGQSIVVTNTATGQTKTAPVVDKCPGCQSNWGLDMSPHLYYGMGGTDAAGHFPISWYWA